MLAFNFINSIIVRGDKMEFLKLVGEVGFPIAGAIAAGFFVFTTLKFILSSVTGSVMGLKGIINALDNRVQTMNNDLVKIDTLMSYALNVKPNVDRIAANEGKEDARRD
tara:strand:- start:377 stop:703 length:327 start_codon:yes stop_codon:yes gene_type:complete